MPLNSNYGPFSGHSLKKQQQKSLPPSSDWHFDYHFSITGVGYRFLELDYRLFGAPAWPYVLQRSGSWCARGMLEAAALCGVLGWEISKRDALIL